MIDLTAESAVTIPVARRDLIPHFNGRPISPATSYRWIERGVLAKDGKRVRLEAVKVGRVLVTTAAAVRNFLDELARHSGVTPESDTCLSSQVQSELVARRIMPTSPADRNGAVGGQANQGGDERE